MKKVLEVLGINKGEAMSKCKSCNNVYTPTDTDDGYCSFECWETTNCGSPELVVSEDDFEV